MITYTYSFKIKPTKQQRTQFEQYLDVCRNVYNFAHKERLDHLESRKCQVNCCSIKQEYIIPASVTFPSYNNQAKALTEAKKRLPFFRSTVPRTDSAGLAVDRRTRSVNAQCLQQVLKRLEKAWSDFFQIPDRGFPRYKKLNRFRSFVFPQLGKNCLDNRRVKLPSIGWIRIKQSRPYPTGFVPKQFQVVKKASGYYLMIVFQSTETVPDVLPGEKSLGIDAGISSFIHTSQNESISSPQFFRKSLKKLKTLQRRLKNKVKGSKNWFKQVNKIALFHEKVADTRRDWLFKLAHRLCNKTDNIFLEDINFKSWSKGLFCKQSLDSGIGSFINEILPFICWKRNKFYLKVDKNYSSQECPNCRLFTGKKLLSERQHKCQFCACEMSRDLASALIIEQRGIPCGRTARRLYSNGL